MAPSARGACLVPGARAAVSRAPRSTDARYEDPFWLERFGERGHRFADEYGLHHVAHLIEAPRLNNASSFGR